ncbi:MAG: hypothetical protein Kow0059_19670 [Candidatus Sumerlaeia bacterium]
MTKPLPSITELPNELTHDIDVVGALGIVRLLRQTDSQIFNGWREYAGLYDDDVLETLERLIGVLAAALKTPERTAVVLSGAGTSGRLAFFIARRFNSVMRTSGRPECFHYLMAGGDKALIRAQEGAEDDPAAAVRDLQRLEQPERTIVYIGITCGCSAPYIAAQLDYAMTRPNFITVLLGFNPVERARRVPIEGWDKTFHDVMSALAACNDDRHFIVNPIIGPEPITGSTRMKGGTATKILLEAVLEAACSEHLSTDTTRGVCPSPKPSGAIDEDVKADGGGATQRRRHLLRSFRQWEAVHRATYLAAQPIASLITAAGEALRRGGHIYYIGRGAFGILGLVDASECPPTFGADFTDVRGFVEGGWKTLENTGGDLSPEGPLYQISIEDFRRSLLPGVNENDLIVFLHDAADQQPLPREIAETALARNTRLACVIINVTGRVPAESSRPSSSGHTPVETAAGGRFEADGVFRMCTHRVLIHASNIVSGLCGVRPFSELACKWVLNAITTGAHVLKGKVFQNRMIDLRISNNKLYYRSIGIISRLMAVDEETARRCLLRAIYGTDELSGAQLDAPVSRHIEAGTTAEKIVPVALLLATGRFTVSDARRALAAEPIVRNVIREFVKD